VKIALTPIDTLFFRDSTPFDQGASPQEGVPSVFPPHPPTVTGAIRAALAREKGWNGRDPWDAVLVAALGDGPDVGPLRVTGPMVLRGKVPVFPLPRHVIASRIASHGDGAPTWRATGWNVPGARVESDLGHVRLPVPNPRAGETDAAGAAGAAGDKASRTGRPWVTTVGLYQILAGRLPASTELMDPSALWVQEPRVGIQRSSGRRTAERGMLYSTRHVRLRPGVRIGVEVAGLPDNWSLVVDAPRSSPRTIALGGESRLATAEAWGGLARGERISDETRRAGRLTLVALTPLRLARGAIAGRVPLAPGMRVACACADRPLRIGGWDSRQRAPLPLTNAVAPGTTLFCEASVDVFDAPDLDLERGLVRVGSDVDVGFGLCAIARAPWEEMP
jgi:CRISPR-associated protein Cmr3